MIAKKNTRQLLTEAIDRWGPGPQLAMLSEECAEVVVAVHHYFRRRGQDSVSLGRIAEEVADVEIMCAQARLILGDSVDEVKKAKLHRLAGRLGVTWDGAL